MEKDMKIKYNMKMMKEVINCTLLYVDLCR